MTDFETQVVTDLSALKSQMAALMGLGQPGRLHALEDRLERHEVYLQRAKGFAGALGVGVTMMNLLIDYWRHH
jgi:hypothetical protein